MTDIDKVREHPAVGELYEAVNASTPITIVQIDEVYWSSRTEDGLTTIEVGRALDPAAALMHELLHAKTKIDGFSQHLTGLPVSRRGSLARAVLGALDNELQHHHMFPAFIAAGFAPEAFYNDDDGESYRIVRQELEEMDQSDDIVKFFLKFLTVIAPGGQGTEEERAQTRAFLFQRCGQTKQAILEEIETDLKAWALGPLQTHAPLLQSILTKLGITGVWVGTSQDFPTEGFFVGEPFSYEDAVAFYESSN